MLGTDSSIRRTTLRISPPLSGVSLSHLPYNVDRRHLRLLLPYFTHGVGAAVHLSFPGVSPPCFPYNREPGGGLRYSSNTPGSQPLSTKLSPESPRLRGISIPAVLPARRTLPVVSFLSGDGWKRIRNTSKCFLLSHSPITAFGPGLRIGAIFHSPLAAGVSRIV